MPLRAQTRLRVQVAVIEDMRPESVVVETELFPRGALDFYTAKNMGWDYTQEQWDTWFSVERGGDQVSAAAVLYSASLHPGLPPV